MTAHRVSEDAIAECLQWLKSVPRMGDVRKYLAALLAERAALEAKIVTLKSYDESDKPCCELCKTELIHYETSRGLTFCLDCTTPLRAHVLAEARKEFAREALEQRNASIRKAANVGASLASADIAFESWLRQQAEREKRGG